MTVLLEGKKLNKQFIDKKKTVDALKDVSFFLQEGEVLGITVILEPKKIKYVTVSIVSPSICHEVMGPDAMILVF